MNTDPATIQIRCFDDFDAISPQDWDALLKVSATRSIFQTRAWQKAWWQAYGKSASPLQPEYALCLMAGYTGASLTMLAPLVRRGDVFYFVGEGVADRLDILYDAKHPLDADALMTALKALHAWDSVALNGIPNSSPTWGHLKQLTRQESFFPITVSKLPLWGLVIEGREERVRRHLHAGTLAKHASIFASKGTMSVQHLKAPDVDTVPWQEFFVQHIYRWSLRSIPSMFVIRAARDLCRAIFKDKDLRIHTIFTRLYLNEQLVAHHLGFIYDKVFYWQMPSFDLGVKRFCPDDVLWREVVAYAYKCGCKEVAFTSSDEPAVRRFSDRVGFTRSVRVFRRHRDEWRARLKRWISRIPLAFFSYRVLKSMGQTLTVMAWRKKLVKEARLAMEGVDSFYDLYLKREMPGWFNFSLAKPEVEIIRRLKPELKDMLMLDMGVGYGRTSVYFSSLVKRYDAFDLVPSMVAVARADLNDLKDCGNIMEANAVSIQAAGDGAYDFILFSGDGLDESSLEDRLRILKEVRRVGREGAVFFFSSRNLQSLSNKKGRSLLDVLNRWRRHLLMTVANENLTRSRFQDSVFLVDDKSGYRFPVYFGTPKEQVRVLKELGFSDVRVFAMRTGLEVRDWRRWDKLTDESLYYLCRV